MLKNKQTLDFLLAISTKCLSKLSIQFGAFILIAFLFNCGVTVNAQSARSEGESLISYENSDYGIKILYPYNWKKVESLEKNQIVSFSAPEITEKKSPTLINVYTPASVTLAVENVSNPNVSLNDFINTYLNRLSTVNNEFQIINITDGTLAGKPAKIIVSEEMDILNHISKVMRTLTLSDGIVYRINYQAEPNQFSSHMPVAQKNDKFL